MADECSSTSVTMSEAIEEGVSAEYTLGAPCRHRCLRQPRLSSSGCILPMTWHLGHAH